ncbi:MAG: hypothetical protein M3Z20_20830 [Chloroflexota bacterium]|nr:hypothetical protein [Chloroflexota bacterium]
MLLPLDPSPGLAEAPATPAPAEANVASAVIDDNRLRFGSIFLGTVVAVTGEDIIPSSDPTDSLPVILYAVEVSQTLRGEAAGRVEIWYYDFTSQSPDISDYGATGLLQVGARYLFFAGFDPIENVYPVADGVGVIPIHNDQEAAHLVASIEPLIAEAAHEEAQGLRRYSCGRVSRPEVSASPAVGKPGDRVVVSATYLVRPQASIWWNDPAGKERLAAVVVQEDCSFTVEVRIPNVAPGEHRVVVLDARGETASADITVVQPFATPVAEAFDPQRDYDQSQASDEIRAYHGAIFIARVDALEREQLHVSTGAAPPQHVQHYLVTVERTLAGGMSGQVSVVYWGAYEETPDTLGFGPLRIGERYLFFAGSADHERAYTVQAGSGTILITSDQQEQDLIDHYLPLIAEADIQEKESIAEATGWAEASAARSGITPTVSIDPEEGPPGTEVIVRGEGFNFREVTVSFGKRRTHAEVAVADGSFQTTIRIPRNAPCGVFWITVDDQRTFAAELGFTVTDSCRPG